MDGVTSKPKLSGALVGAWLLLAVITPVGRFATWWLLQKMTGDWEDADWETFGQVMLAEFAVITLLWGVLLYGLRVTAKAQDTPQLHRAFGLFLAQFIIDTAVYGTINLQLLEIETTDWLAYTGIASGLCAVAGGFSVIAHAKLRGATPQEATLPTAAQLAYLFVIVSGPVFQAMEVELNPDLWTGVYILILVLYWFGWLALPREAFALNPDGQALPTSAPPNQLVDDASAGQDILVGALWAGAGTLLTVLSFSGGGIGGRAVLAYGPIIYGLFRIVRGLGKRAG